MGLMKRHQQEGHGVEHDREAIVQTCTTEGSVGDVEKGSLVRESKPGRVSTKCRNSDSDFVSIGDGDSNPWMH